MSLIAHNALPSFTRLQSEGLEVIEPGRAHQQDIRDLHIGILNMMPDAALEATERQFLRMVGSCNRIAQFTVHMFTIDAMPRGPQAQQHIAAYYDSFAQLKEEGLDALIITGANPEQDDLSQESFWPQLMEVVEWASENVSSVLCSCLATHAIVQHRYGIDRYKLAQKRWGVYSHRITRDSHPLTANINTRFDAPHSHVFEVNAMQLRKQGLRVLAASEEADVHVATSPDGFRFLFFQGHPEYDMVSLLKEYQREVTRYLEGVHDVFPAYPEHYFNQDASGVISRFRDTAIEYKFNGGDMPEFPYQDVVECLENTWSDTGKAIVNNWLGLVYQLTNADRKRPFMDKVDPANPLNLGADY